MRVMLHQVTYHDRPILHGLEVDALELHLPRKTSEKGTTLSNRYRRHDERDLVDEIGREEALR